MIDPNEVVDVNHIQNEIIVKFMDGHIVLLNGHDVRRGLWSGENANADPSAFSSAEPPPLSRRPAASPVLSEERKPG